nr:hypothetical protein CFP56_64902 [Quercus suber]
MSASPFSPTPMFVAFFQLNPQEFSYGILHPLFRLFPLDLVYFCTISLDPSPPFSFSLPRLQALGLKTEKETNFRGVRDCAKASARHRQKRFGRGNEEALFMIFSFALAPTRTKGNGNGSSEKTRSGGSGVHSRGGKRSPG